MIVHIYSSHPVSHVGLASILPISARHAVIVAPIDARGFSSGASAVAGIRAAQQRMADLRREGVGAGDWSDLIDAPYPAALARMIEVLRMQPTTIMLDIPHSPLARGEIRQSVTEAFRASVRMLKKLKHGGYV